MTATTQGGSRLLAADHRARHLAAARQRQLVRTARGAECGPAADQARSGRRSAALLPRRRSPCLALS